MPFMSSWPTGCFFFPLFFPPPYVQHMSLYDLRQINEDQRGSVAPPIIPERHGAYRIFITYVTYYEKDSDSRKTYPTVLNRNITVLNCHNCYGTGTTLHANTQLIDLGSFQPSLSPDPGWTPASLMLPRGCSVACCYRLTAPSLMYFALFFLKSHDWQTLIRW